MKQNFKKISVLVIMVVVLSLATCFAESGNTLNSSNETLYIDNLEQYEEIMNEAGGYTDEELEGYYNYYHSTINEKYERTDALKAKVTSAGKLETKYEIYEEVQNSQNYQIPLKFLVQEVEVEILEGEYQGQKFDVSYIANGDILNNAKYSELKVGDTVFVLIGFDEESEEVIVEFSEQGVNVERFGVVVCIGIIAGALFIVYSGKKGIFTTILLALMLIFGLIIIPNTYVVHSGFIISGICLIGLITILLSLFELGINKNALKAILTSLIMIGITTLGIIVVNHFTNINGINFETIAFSNLAFANDVNMESLYVIITLIIAAFAITNVVCKSLIKFKETNAQGFNEKINSCKEVLNSNVLMVIITILALYIPNHLYLVTNKYTNIEICNAETFMSELVRMFIIIISMSITVPLIAFFDEDKK